MSDVTVTINLTALNEPCMVSVNTHSGDTIVYVRDGDGDWADARSVVGTEFQVSLFLLSVLGQVVISAPWPADVASGRKPINHGGGQ